MIKSNGDDTRKVQHDALYSMWSFLQMGGQKTDKGTVEHLMEECAWLVKVLTQKTAGQRKGDASRGYVPWTEAETHMNFIILGALALYLSGSLENLKDIMEEEIMDKPLTVCELADLAKDKPVVVWTVCLDEETKQPDLSTGEWLMFDGRDFVAPGVEDDLSEYGTRFVAYREEPTGPVGHYEPPRFWYKDALWARNVMSLLPQYESVAWDSEPGYAQLLPKSTEDPVVRVFGGPWLHQGETVKLSEMAERGDEPKEGNHG
jgi:hypothetical protein